MGKKKEIEISVEDSLRKSLEEANEKLESIQSSFDELLEEYDELNYFFEESENILSYLLANNEENKKLLDKYSNTTHYLN